jgi:hypothetical protein
MPISRRSPCRIAHVAVLALACTAGLAQGVTTTSSSVELGGTVFTVQGMVGVGRLPANLRDAYGETFGSISGLWADAASWTRVGDTYTGTFLAAPDRGYNIAGTIDYAPRLNTLQMSFTPAATAATAPGQGQIALSLTGSTLLYESLAGGGAGLFSGLDPVPGGVATGGARPATALWPELPQAFNGKLALDAEGVVVLGDGSRLISDEYGPSIYRFAPDGRFVGALEVAASVRPIRNGVTDYSSNNPGVGQPAPSPANPTAGRANNQGFEGLTLSPDGRTLFVGLQSAARQDINLANAAATRDHTRIFTYDVSDLDNIRLTGEYVVQLPRFTQGSSTLVAAQSELLALSSTQLLMLPRDSNGRLVGTQVSLLRQVEVLDLSEATNVLGAAYEQQVAPGGVLNPAITPVAKTLLLDINDRSQLNRFGLTNGLQDGFENLTEKWEGMALLPALDPARPDDYFLFIANDNDFATTDGFHAGAAYNDGKDLDTLFLAWRVTISPVPEPGSALLMTLGGAVLLGAARRKSSRPVA